MSTPRALIIRTAGTNCDAEMTRAFALAGAEPELVHLDALVREPSRLEAYDLIGFPGGFSYGDDIASGRVLAMKLRESLYPALRDAARRGVPMIGVCNGFQAMAQLGLLPGPERGQWPEDAPPAASVALLENDSARFIDRWVRVDAPESVCVWTRDLWPVDRGDRTHAMRLPIAHAEGRFFAAPGELERLESAGQIALRYAEPVNGSAGNVAGLCDPSGRILGLMPHPERYAEWRTHPFWTRLPPETRRGAPPGLRLFQNAVSCVLEGSGQPAGAARVDE
jgi:phosphoribosylformylglycinamidine synthase subunit PurQ / glutaminase